MAVWFDLAQVIGRDASQLEAEAAFALVSHELATIDRELAALALKYGVPNPAALEETIRQNTTSGHPAWEDSIDWSNLIAYREKILAAAATLGRQNDC